MTIHDIAREAQVSITTVSRALNKPEQVTKSTLDKINAIIEKHHFKPSIFARGLMKSKTNSVGILVPNISNPYIISIINSLEESLYKKDVFIYLCNIGKGDSLEAEYADELLRRKVDALIVVELGSFCTAHNPFLTLDAHCPVILINEHVSVSEMHYTLRCDQEPGVIAAFEHYQKNDRFPIGLVIGEDQFYSFRYKIELLQAFKKKHGLSDNDIQIHQVKNADAADVSNRSANLVSSLIEQKKLPRGLIAGNDLIAMGILHSCLAHRIHLPDQCSLISIDNTYLARIATPAISSVDLRMEELGQMAAKLYLDLAGGDTAKPEKLIKLPSRLILRETA